MKLDARKALLTQEEYNKFIFSDLDGFDAGEYRKYNVSKSEPVLFGKSVRYEDWQIHPFKVVNTRTVVVFAIQYLSFLGFKLNNEPFAENAAYFRDALVRAGYNNMEYKISPDFTYIIQFFENVLYNKKHELNSEELIVMELTI